MGVLGGAAAFPGRGWAGLAGLVSGLVLGRVDAPWAPSAASILAWWGLALALDAAAFRRRGKSLLEDAPDAFVWMAVLSIFLGVGMEWAAGRLAGWSYLGLPSNEFLRYGVQGAVVAAFLPALHDAAGLLGAGDLDAAKPLSKSAAVAAVVLGAGATGGALGVGAPALSGLLALLPVTFGLWTACDGVNALRSRPSLLASPGRMLAAWCGAGLGLTAAGALITWASGQGRYPAGFEGPSLYEYALLAFLGPALRAAYLFLADTLGLPAWPGREKYFALIR